MLVEHSQIQLTWFDISVLFRLVIWLVYWFVYVQVQQEISRAGGKAQLNNLASITLPLPSD